ncbi:MAG TPA: AMP-binding protein, partial [Blastocatellia bacterium]|nr:AMP-binding protein [Blastocatellia bacterium]
MTRLLQQWLSREAERRPEAIALVYGSERVTYAELERASNRLARVLRELGCEKGDRVCFLIPKSPAAIISLLGIMKADCAHVPLDTASPAPRLARIVESCEPRFILAGGSSSSSIESLLDQVQTTNPVRIGWMGTRGAGRAGVKAEFSLEEINAESSEPV